MAFADLCAECDRMLADLEEEWVPDYFDILFVAAGAGELYGGLYGYDEYEQDYFGIESDSSFAEDAAKRKLKQMTKDELIAGIRQCFKIYAAYIGLKNRYDSLKAGIDILRDQNTGYLQVVKEIERLYEAASTKQGTADAQEVLEYLTTVLRGESSAEVIVVEGCGDGCSEAKIMEKGPSEKERLKAAELLGKRFGLYTEKLEVKDETERAEKLSNIESILNQMKPVQEGD